VINALITKFRNYLLRTAEPCCVHPEQPCPVRTQVCDVTALKVQNNNCLLFRKRPGARTAFNIAIILFDHDVQLLAPAASAMG
jgi:hypothetical protein